MNLRPADSPLPLARLARVGVLGEGDALSEALSEALASGGRKVPRRNISDANLGPLHVKFDVVFLTLGWDRMQEKAEVLSQVLANVVVVVCTTSLGRDSDGYFMHPVPEGSVTQLADSLLPHSRVVGAFHQFSAAHVELANLGAFVSDVPLVGDDREATDLVEALIDEVRGLDAVYVGGLAAARAVEGFAAIVSEIARGRPGAVGFRLHENFGGLRFLD